MFKKISLGAAAALTAMTVMPSAAEAGHRGGYYDGGRYEQRYDNRYDRRDRDGYYGRSYRGDSRYARRCKGTTGTIVGGVAGALLGREITRDRYRGRSGTTGAILGGAVGALAGRGIDKSSCRNRY